MFCKKCGTKMEVNAKFCANCGESLEVIAPIKKTKSKEGRLFFVGGVILTVLGVLCTLQGFEMNQDFRMFLKYGPNPGNANVTLGLMMFAVGILLLVLRYLKKQKQSD